MNEIIERLARMEERGLHRDEKINEVAASVRAIDTKLDEIRYTHIANAAASSASLRAHKFWVGGIAATVSGTIAILAKAIPFFGTFPR